MTKHSEHKGEIPVTFFGAGYTVIDSAYLDDQKNVSGLTDEKVKSFRSYKTKAVSIKPYLQEHIIALLALYNHSIFVFGM
ncbi:MAG: hypothetical protein AAGA02_12185 [Bacteroidota bacterium]